MHKCLKFFSIFFIIISMPVSAGSLTLSSDDIAQGQFMNKAHEFNGFGCTGSDVSPHIEWSNVPEGTKSFVVMVHDPDAPTGSGWWHWQIVNIPIEVTELAQNAGSTTDNRAPAGSLQIQNDYGASGFGGACPPQGHGVHRYRFTVHALSVEKLELPEGASGALVGFMVNANTIEKSTIEALYKRD